ncbi:unnamed protein product [Nippostrongylus brasiliensis]|uniref:Secreted protein n=1 Tax=Nippostrongylus brasiliensis TaxID=27835 RepID=A0A0N4YKN1_NIPBR|nr:unnamed protein product [Nippostrongylus brasiliensis]
MYWAVGCCSSSPRNELEMRFVAAATRAALKAVGSLFLLAKYCRERCTCSRPLSSTRRQGNRNERALGKEHDDGYLCRN